MSAPEDAVVVAEVLRRLRDLVGQMSMRADGNVNQADLYLALNEECDQARREAEGKESSVNDPEGAPWKDDPRPWVQGDLADLVGVGVAVRRVAADGSWVEVELPSGDMAYVSAALAPPHRARLRLTVLGEDD